MKKQINPNIKAHLIRSSFYVVLLLAVCVIPFALAQRNTTKRSAAKPAPTTTATKAQLEAQFARAKAGAPGSVLGKRHLAPQRKSASGQALLPYDVRRAPSLPQLSSKFPWGLALWPACDYRSDA